MECKYVEDFKLESVDNSDSTFQPRLDYDDKEIEALAGDISRNGQRNPIGLRKKGDEYQIIYGFQRVMAIKLLKRETIKATVYEKLSDSEAREQSISDNLRHGDLTDIEKALECRRLKEQGYTIPQLEELFGVKKSVIYNYLTVAKLGKITQQCIHRNFISINHGIELARIKDISKRLEILRRTISCGISVRGLKHWIRTGTSPIIYLPTTPWIDICPKELKLVPISKCAECDHYGGRNERGEIACSYPTPSFLLALERKDCEKEVDENESETNIPDKEEPSPSNIDWYLSKQTPHPQHVDSEKTL